MLWKYSTARQTAGAQPSLKESSTAYCISSLIEIPPSFNMGVTSSARYNHMWGISMAISSAISKVSENLKKKKKRKMLSIKFNSNRDFSCKVHLHLKNPLLKTKANHKDNKEHIWHLMLANASNLPGADFCRQ